MFANAFLIADSSQYEKFAHGFVVVIVPVAVMIGPIVCVPVTK